MAEPRDPAMTAPLSESMENVDGDGAPHARSASPGTPTAYSRFCVCVPWEWLPACGATQAMRRDPLLAGTLVGVLLGLVVGMALAPLGMGKWVNELISIPGECFLRLLKLLVLPLVVGSITAGVMSLRRLGSGAAVQRTARRALGLYTLTYVLAMVNALAMVTLIHPGGSSDATATEAQAAPAGSIAAATAAPTGAPPPLRWQCESETAATVNKLAADAPKKTLMSSVTDVLYGAIPTNIVHAAAETNILGVIMFAILIAAYLPVAVGEKPPTRAEACVHGMNDVIFQIATAVLQTTPVAIFSLIIGKITAACDIGARFASLAWFIVTVLTSILIHGFVTLPLIYAVFTRKSPLHFYKAFAKAILTALAISSSAATLPVTIKCADDFGVPNELSRFVLVLGATANMDGTAMYEAIAAVYIMQSHGHALDAASLVLVAITASLSAMGAAAIPSAGLVTLITVLQAVNMEQHAGDIAYIMVVDWFLDRVRTSVNVMGDAYALCIVDHLGAAERGDRGHTDMREVELGGVRGDAADA